MFMLDWSWVSPSSEISSCQWRCWAVWCVSWLIFSSVSPCCHLRRSRIGRTGQPIYVRWIFKSFTILAYISTTANSRRIHFLSCSPCFRRSCFRWSSCWSFIFPRSLTTMGVSYHIYVHSDVIGSPLLDYYSRLPNYCMPLYRSFPPSQLLKVIPCCHHSIHGCQLVFPK